MALSAAVRAQAEEQVAAKLASMISVEQMNDILALVEEGVYPSVAKFFERAMDAEVDRGQDELELGF